MTEKNYAEGMPDRNDTDIPERVQWFLSVCELAHVYHEWLEQQIGTQKDSFCNGVVDYWWDHDTLEEPTFDMLFNPLVDNPAHDWPTQERIAYQKGAIVGYQLAEEYKDGD